MSEAVRALEPKAVWNHFADMNEVPRPSKKEERIIQFMVDFGNSLGLPTEVDEVGNVFIRKAATPGMEDRTPVVMQAHLDMVCQKNNDTEFDFDTQGIQMLVEGDWVRANGTTLGADNGIGVAMIMAVLASSDIPHPGIDALFTIDEETGMTGALALQPNMLNGKILLNIDTEDDDELTIGCAGGIDITAKKAVATVALSGSYQGVALSVKGLSGGHSGMDIHKGLGNANKIMNRFFDLVLAHGGAIASVDGGGLRNAIPRESNAVVAIPEGQYTAFTAAFDALAKAVVAELGTTDPHATITATPVETPETVLDAAEAKALVAAVFGAHSGIFRMSPDIEGLVNTSNNVARVLVANGEALISCLTRSAAESEKGELATALTRTFEAAGYNVVADGAYPGWTPNPKSAILTKMSTLYREMFNDEPKIQACHAGLECGILGTNYPEMELISFGPNIRGAHSPDEKCQISSVAKSWNFLLATLADIPNV